MKRLKKVIFSAKDSPKRLGRKVFLSSIWGLFLLLFLVGCNPSKNRLSDWMNEKEKLRVLSTTAQVGTLVDEIGKGRVNSWILIQGDLDPHSYEIVKGDSEKFSRADLIFYNGLGLEHGASLSSLLKNSSKSLAVGDAIEREHSSRILRENGVVDPHVWMDISLWKEGIRPIVQALSQLDPEGEDLYRKNGEMLALEMEKRHWEIYTILQEVPSEKRYLVTSHDAFHYFTRSYLADPGEEDWRERFKAPEGLAPEGQLNPKDIQKIIDHLSERDIHVLFPESNVSKDSIRKIVSAGKELGLELSICESPLYGDAMSYLTYFEMMERNARTIANHLWNMQ